MKKYRRVYLEITDTCNLNCSFCARKTTKRGNLAYRDFTNIVDQLVGITPVLYYHVLGEPLLHPDLIKMLHYTQEKGINNALTTNGSKLNEFRGKWQGIRLSRINLSLQAYLDKNNNLSIEEAKKVVIEGEELQKETNTMIFLRLWDMNNPLDGQMAEWLSHRYQVSIDKNQVTKPNGFELTKNIRLHQEKLFVWPTQASNGQEIGFCEGLRTHFGILSDGTVVPCCLDANGDIPLGNCLKEEIKDILEKPTTLEIYNSFSNRHPINSLCRKCEYKSRFDR